MQENYGMRQLQFLFSPGAVSFLRVHLPERFGDVLAQVRPILAAVGDDGKARTGFEIGRVYSGVRGVVAVRDGARPDAPILGVLEAGSSFDAMVAHLDAKLDAGLAILLRREEVENIVWPERLEKNGARDPACACYLETASRPLVRAWMQGGLLARVFSAYGTRRLAWQGRDYQLVSLPLHDYLHAEDPARPPVGTVLIWKDQTDLFAAAAAHERALIAGLLLAYALCLVLLFWGLRQTRRRLGARIRAATEALAAERRLFVGGPVLTVVWDPHGDWPVRYISDNVENVLGFAARAMQAAGRGFLDFLPAEARASVRQALEAHLQGRDAQWEMRFQLCCANGLTRGFYAFCMADWQPGKQAPQEVRGYLIDQTEQWRLEAALQKTTARYEETLAAISEGLWEWDLLRNTVHWDARCWSLIGQPHDPNPLPVEHLMQMVHLEDLQNLQEGIAAGMRTPEGFALEFRLRRADESWVWIETRGRVVEWQDGQAVRAVGTHSDISARKVAELALRASQARLLAVLNALPDLILVFDTSGCLRRLHQPEIFRSVFGDLESRIGEEAGSLLPEPLDEAFAVAVADVTRHNAASDFDIDLRERDGGQLRRFHARLSPVLESGSPYPTGFLLSLRDTTEGEQARKQRQQLALRNAAILDGAGDGIYGMDADGCCLFINRAALDMLGFTEAEVIGRATHALFHHHRENGEDYPREACPATLTVQDGQVRRIEAEWFWRRDGSGLPVSMTITPLVEEGKRIGAVVVFRDQSAQRAQAEALLHLATTDMLTELPNRRYFMTRLEEEWARLHRLGGRAALMMIDLDHFKRVNDNYGHGTGDRVLQAFAEVLRRSLRRMDVPGRLGGEEFAVILPGADLAGAHKLAERLRQAVESMRVPDAEGEPVRITVSIGVASFNPETATFDALLKRADEALYRAKRHGRNRVEDAGV
jgi:diguanylate cyclase (GGDEF)-like protein/PAS domain S-box-containing protein